MNLKIQIFIPSRTSWIATDITILSQLGEVEVIDVFKTRFWRWAVGRLSGRGADFHVFWFGSLRYLPYLLTLRLFRSRILIIAGGYDVENRPDLCYAAHADSWYKRFLRRMVFSCADSIFTVSGHVRSQLLGFSRNQNVVIVPLAFPPPPMVNLIPYSQRNKQVVFLISAVSDDRWLVKGMDRISMICRQIRDVQFVLAGQLCDSIRSRIEDKSLPNLTLAGFLPFQGPGYIDLLNESRIICLPSRHESFGAALIDGALLGCYPISFAVGGIPETLSGLGDLIEDGDLDSLVQSIRYHLDVEVPVEQIQRIASERFSLDRRQDAFASVFKLKVHQDLQPLSGGEV